MYYFIKLTKRMKVELIETDDYDFESLAALIDCDYIEHVRITKLETSPSICFIVDEEGALKKGRELNPLATSLYGADIYGDVLIAFDGINEYGFRDIMPLSESMSKSLMDMFTEVLKDL